MRAAREPKFEREKPDFDLFLTALPRHPELAGLPRATQLCLSSQFHVGWMKDTIDLETGLLSEAARAVINTPDIRSEVKREVAIVASKDEGTHVVSALQVLIRTEAERGPAKSVPNGSLVRNYRRVAKDLSDRDRQLFGLGVSLIVEISQGGLKHLAESDEINPYQRYQHGQHWKDEEHHQAVFSALVPEAYRALPEDERKTLVAGIVSGAWWAGSFDREFAVRALINIGFDVSRAVRIAGEIARDCVSCPVPVGETLLRAIGVPSERLIEGAGPLWRL